jgi:hypothetical protein
MKPQLLLIVLAGLITNAQLNAQGLLINGGFNAQGFPYPNDLNSILAPWHWSGSIAYTWANDGPTNGPGTTLDSGGMVGFGDGSIFQQVATTPGLTYALTITAHSRGTTSGTWLQPLWNGVALPRDFAQYFEWTSTTYDIQATANSTLITIMPAPNNQGPTWIDSVSLVVIPEPSAICLIVAGCGFFLANLKWRHYRRT